MFSYKKTYKNIYKNTKVNIAELNISESSPALNNAPVGLSLSIAKTSFARMTQRFYWLYEQQVAYGDNLTSRLNRCVKNWIMWAKTRVGEVYLLTQIHVKVNFKYDLKNYLKDYLSNLKNHLSDYLSDYLSDNSKASFNFINIATRPSNQAGYKL